jgi:hypothetical protein
MQIGQFVDTRKRLDPKTAAAVLGLDPDWFDNSGVVAVLECGSYRREAQNRVFNSMWED